MKIWSFAFMGKRRKLVWSTIAARTDGLAIKKYRKLLGYDFEIFAGPLPQKCQLRDCNKQAVAQLGKGKWLNVCREHNTGVIPHHTSYVRK